MGAAFTSLNLSDPQQQQLLSEYVSHSRKTADECAHIFRGSLGMYDEEENDPPPSSLGSRKSAYPRHIQLAQFEEVFGMLVADPEPHFRFFHHGKIVAEDAKLKAEATVCVHRVFCTVALLMKADLHSQVDFILRLYADIAGDLTPEAKSSLLKDFFTSLEVVFQLADSIPGNVIASAEKAFWSDEPGKLMTVRELYGVCLTNPQISGMLHSVHTLIEASRRQEKLRRRESKVQSQQMSVGQGGDCNSMRGPSSCFVVVGLEGRARMETIRYGNLPIAFYQAGDYDSFWQKPELLQIRASETCAHALEKMVRVDAQSVLVVESSETTRSKACRLVGLVSTEKLLLYFLHFLVPGFQSSTAKTYEHTRTRAEEAIRQFGAALLSDVVRFYFAERAPLLGTIRDDEAFFSVLLRFACGESSVAVAQNYSSDPAAVLGCLTVHDMLTWLDKDLMLLKGQERCAVAAFPQFFYAPAKIDPVSASASVCEGLVEMASRKLAGILLETSASNTGRSMLRRRARASASSSDCKRDGFTTCLLCFS
ncbi:hypothetical protein JG688_00004195 [Phytophthora aleatoria]|uniref:Uncharacterized protein n=1 Tax=Phytophthora aleatoria TaxID=2496075 RepID=A0A8J5M7G4_9STRA|nr:hypothetical protein JG688_00004195 [Phytophthora aleatoria]